MDETQDTGMDRRRFLTVLGVTGAGTAALSGCSTDRVQKLIPYLVQSEDQVPGIPTYYASTCTECAAGCGLHVKTREARAIKLEGNPAHPVNLGSLCARGQSALQAHALTVGPLPGHFFSRFGMPRTVCLAATNSFGRSSLAIPPR